MTEQLFDVKRLTAVGVTKITVKYSGSNDDGEIGEVTIKSKRKLNENIKIELDDRATTVSEELLQEEHPGWELNAGSSGEIIFEVKNNKVIYHIHHNQYYEESEYSEESGVLN